MNKIKSMKKTGLLALVCTLGFVGQAATAAPVHVDTNITRLTNHTTLHGQCYAQLSNNLPASLSCSPAQNWVSFDCEGNFNDPQSASQMFDTATLAMVTDRPVGILVTDEQKLNGMCVVKRITVIK